MTSPVVRGMPYATVWYRFRPGAGASVPLPAVASETSLRTPPLLDGVRELPCSSSSAGDDAATIERVESKIRLVFAESDFAWLVFFGRPAYVRCAENEDKGGGSAIALHVVDVAKDAENSYSEDNNDERDEEEFLERDASRANNAGGGVRSLTVCVALANNCTSGTNPMYCERHLHRRDAGEYEALLQRHADLYPGPGTNVGYEFFSPPVQT